MADPNSDMPWWRFIMELIADFGYMAHPKGYKEVKERRKTDAVEVGRADDGSPIIAHYGEQVSNLAQAQRAWRDIKRGARYFARQLSRMRR